MLSSKFNVFSLIILRRLSLRMSQFTSEEFNKLISPAVVQVRDVFQRNNYELRLCGGAVRDLLQGKEPKDIDFATTALPEEMLTLCSENCWRTINANGLSHGTVTIRLDDINFEITTLRIDKVTDGRRASVEFTTDWKLDAERRDLTFNSLFLGLDGTLYDYFDGANDLRARRVRFVGDAEKRIQEDYLRILRYFRFFGVVDADVESHDDATLNCIRANANGLERISGERIWTELRKIVLGNKAPHLMEKMYELDLFKFYGLPSERHPLPEFETVYNRCKHFSPLPITVLSAVFQTEAEVLTFDKRVKFSRLERLIALFIVQHKSEARESQNSKYFQDILVDNKDFPPLGHPLFEYLKYIGDSEMLKELENWNVPKFPISGYDLKEFNVKPGRQAGNILKRLREKWKASNFLDSKEELLKCVPNLVLITSGDEDSKSRERTKKK